MQFIVQLNELLHLGTELQFDWLAKHPLGAVSTDSRGQNTEKTLSAGMASLKYLVYYLVEFVRSTPDRQSNNVRLWLQYRNPNGI
jgi:hypothetical protein